MRATEEQIANHFWSVPCDSAYKHNWGLTDHHNPNLWHVDDNTYINGIPLTVDYDYEVGHLLEIVERDTGLVTYIVVVSHRHGRTSQEWDAEPEPFAKRGTPRADVAVWATTAIHQLLDATEVAPAHPHPRIPRP